MHTNNQYHGQPIQTRIRNEPIRVVSLGRIACRTISCRRPESNERFNSSLNVTFIRICIATMMFSWTTECESALSHLKHAWIGSMIVRKKLTSFLLGKDLISFLTTLPSAISSLLSLKMLILLRKETTRISSSTLSLSSSASRCGMSPLLCIFISTRVSSAIFSSRHRQTRTTECEGDEEGKGGESRDRL